MRDNEGRLIPVYHGTNADFTVFEKINKYPGYWFTAEKEYAESFGANLGKYYLNLKNPFNIENLSEQEKVFNDFFENKNYNEEDLYSKEFRNYLLSNGFDGMMWLHSGEYTYIALNSNQAKLTSNTTPTDNPDIRYARKVADINTDYVASSITKQGIAFANKRKPIKISSKEHWRINQAIIDQWHREGLVPEFLLVSISNDPLDIDNSYMVRYYSFDNFDVITKAKLDTKYNNRIKGYFNDYNRQYNKDSDRTVTVDSSKETNSNANNGILGDRRTSTGVYDKATVIIERNRNSNRRASNNNSSNGSLKSLKEQQLEVIQNSNPMLDDIHTGIRSVDEIKTFEEAIEEYKDGVAPDFTKYMIDKAIKNNSITVYSSYPIENGTFVTPSKMIAQDYAGNGEIYSKRVKLTDVAWIDGGEGQYANVDEAYSRNVSFTADDFKALKAENRKLSQQNKKSCLAVV